MSLYSYVQDGQMDHKADLNILDCIQVLRELPYQIFINDIYAFYKIHF